MLVFIGFLASPLTNRHSYLLIDTRSSEVECQFMTLYPSWNIRPNYQTLNILVNILRLERLYFPFDVGTNSSLLKGSFAYPLRFKDAKINIPPIHSNHAGMQML